MFGQFTFDTPRYRTGTRITAKSDPATANGRPDHSSPICKPAAYNLAKAGPAIMIPIDWDIDIPVYSVATCSELAKEVATLIIATTNGMESDAKRDPIINNVGLGAMKTPK